MRRQSVIGLALVFIMWLGLAFECRSQGPNQTAETTGTITNVKIWRPDFASSDMTVTYKYVVDGKNHEHEKSLKDVHNPSQSTHAVGVTGKVCYDPDDPADSFFQLDGKCPPVHTK